MTTTATAFVEEIMSQGRRRPRAMALVETKGRTLTYGELVRRVEGAAAELQRHGLGPGDPVLFTVRPSIASISLILAVMRAGGVLVAADPRMGAEVFRSRVALARPRWVIAETAVYLLGAGRPLQKVFGRRLPELAPLADISAHHVRVGPPFPGNPPAIPATRLWGAAPQPRATAVLRAGDDPVAIIFTSGTTAAPKAVVHTESSIGAALGIMLQHLELGSEDVVFTSELHLTLPALHAGCTTVIPRWPMPPARMAAQIDGHRATVAFAVPSDVEGLARWSQRTGARLPSRLRMLLLGSAPSYASFLERLRMAIAVGTDVWTVYAMTEMLPCCRVSMTEKLDTRTDGDLVGQPFPGVGVRTAADGEVHVSGPNLFRGYLGEPDANITEHATGDVGRFDGRNRLVLLGRRKDMIIRRGENIYPALVENSVLSVPGVTRCRLVGIPAGDAHDERVVLAVEAAAGVDPAELERRLRRALSRGARRVDTQALPDDIVVRRIPLDRRSRKVDTTILKRELSGAPTDGRR
jgi:acyl-CoA synthetase (AMP-forming)/AMP-acid ligase II